MVAMREAKILNLCRHPNVLHLHHAYMSRSGKVYLVTEYVESTLVQHLKLYRKRGGGMPPPLVRSIMHQLVLGVEYLHSIKV